MLLYVLPLVFAVSGVNFPIGVLIYWLTTNVWSMCQQFYVIRRMPAPGSAAEKACTSGAPRTASRSRGVRRQGPDGGAGTAAEELAAVTGQRQQPTSKKRKKTKGRPPRRPAPE